MNIRSYTTLLLTLVSCMMLKAQTIENIQAFIDKDCYLTGEQILVHVSVTDADHKPMDMSKVAYVELCDTKQMHSQCMVQLKNGEGWAALDLPGSMHSGNYQMNVYTRYQRNFGSDCYYKRFVSVVNLLNPSADDDIEFLPLSAKSKSKTEKGQQRDLTNKYEYSVREKVSFSMPKVQGRSFTLSVCRKDVATDDFEEVNYAPKFKALDQITYVPEFDGHIALAKAADGKQIDNSRLALVGKAATLFDGQIQKDGTVRYYTQGLYGSLPTCINGYSYGDAPVQMEFILPYEQVLPESVPALKLYYDENELKDRSISAQIEKSKRDISLGTIIEHKTEFMRTKPDYFYDLDEYTKFRTVREIIIEFVFGLRTRTIDKRKVLFTFDSDTKEYSKWPAIVLLDGMPVYDIDALMDYDARRLKYVQIYSGRYLFGKSPCQGVISFISRKGSLQDFLLDEGTQMFTYDFPQNRPAMLSPIYDDKSSRQPDFRHTLYFNPEVSGDCEFYTSDLTGTYQVLLQYVGNDNQEHRIMKEIIVK